MIGTALAAKATTGWGHRRIASSLGVPETTVRDWMRAFVGRAEAIRTHFTRLAARLDPQLGAIEARASPLQDACEAIALAHQAADHRLGVAPLWSFVSAATAGRLVNNTNLPFSPSW